MTIGQPSNCTCGSVDQACRSGGDNCVELVLGASEPREDHAKPAVHDGNGTHSVGFHRSLLHHVINNP